MVFNEKKKNKQIKLSYSSTSSANNSDEETSHINTKKKKSLSETDISQTNRYIQLLLSIKVMSTKPYFFL
jgi:hypothetical protein